MKYSEYLEYFDTIETFKTKYDILSELNIDDKTLEKILNYFYRKKIIKYITYNKIKYYISNKFLESENKNIKSYFESTMMKHQMSYNSLNIEEIKFDDIFKIEDFCV